MSQLEPLSQEEKKWATLLNDMLINYVGKENSIPSSQLANNIGERFNTTVTGARIRKMIAYLRFEKKPICASNKGYYWAKDNKELEDYAQSLRDRLLSTRQTLLSIIETIKNG